MREVVDLPDAQLAALDAWRVARGMSRAEAIEQAVKGLVERGAPDGEPQAEYAELDEHRRDMQVQSHFDEILTLLRAVSRSEVPTDAAALAQLKQAISRMVVKSAFGLWKARALDGLAEQERLRAEWDDR